MIDKSIQPSKDVRNALDNAYTDWKNETTLDGKKYVFFEHHCEMLFGCKFDYNYNRRTFHNWQIVDEQKYTVFLMKYL